MELHEGQTLTLAPIGVVRTVYHEKYAAPRQPHQPLSGVSAVSSEFLPQSTPPTAVIELLPHRNFEQALSDLAGCERIWLITWFHHNTTWKPKILPPRGRTKRGVFATRSPHRPNPLGISVVDVHSVDGLRIFIGNCDALDGTPVLDVKPYIPLYDSFPESRVVWFDDERAAAQQFTVECSARARGQFIFLEERGVRLWDYVRGVVERDPLPHPYRRIKILHDGCFELAMKFWRVAYRVEDERVTVEHVRSAWIASTAEEGIPSEDEHIHREFLQRWSDL